MFIGAHESVAGGLENAVEAARKDLCQSLQIFVRPNRRWNASSLTDQEVIRFRAAMVDAGLVGRVVAHDIYLVNLSSMDEEVRQKSLLVLDDELTRCERLGVSALIFHAGSPREMGEEWGLRTLAANLDSILKKRVEAGSLVGSGRGGVGEAGMGMGHAGGVDAVTLCVENSAGQGASLCNTLESIAALLGLMEFGDHMGVCIDTCHAYAAGYKLDSHDGWLEFMDQLGTLVGLHRVKLFHLNDSKGTMGSRVDRHAPIGEGNLGIETFRRILNDSRLTHLPGILETPGDQAGETPYRREVELLRSLRG